MDIRIKSFVVLASVAVWALASSAGSLRVAGTPFSLTALVTGNTVTLTWTAAFGDQTTYVIEAGSAPGLTDLANFPTGNLATTFTATNVPNGVYFVRVRSANAAGVSAPSNEATVIVVFGGCLVPHPPAGLTATVRGTVITLGWSSGSDATSYQLEAGSAPGLANLFVGDIGNTRTLAVTAPPGVYYVRVRGKNACGLSAPSNEIAVTVTATGAVTITFANAGANRSPFVSHTEFGFIVVPTSASWIVLTTYGNPAPFIQFESRAGQETTGEVSITAAAGVTFTFDAVDLYSSTTPIPYVFVGLLNSATVFTATGTVPNTFGRFATVSNPYPTAIIDTLLIRLSNPAAPCCSNPVGLDNIVLSF